MTIPLWILFIHGFATGFLTTWLGLVLVNIQPSIRKLMVVGLSYAILAMIIRTLPLQFGLHFFIVTISLILIVQLIWGLSFIKAFISVLLGNLIMALGEALFITVILKMLNADMSTLMANTILLLVIPLPQIIMTILLIWLLSHYGIHIFNFSHDLHFDHSFINFSIRKDKTIIVLVVIMFTLLIFQVFLVIANVYQPQIFGNTSAKTLAIVMSLSILITTLIMLYLIGQLIKLVNQENEFIVQQTYLETVDEMIFAIRAQQHDQISHLQTLYGYMQLGYLEDARKYLEEMIGEIALSQRFADIRDTGLSALAYTKTALSIAKGIHFEISVNTDLSHLIISPYELNKILGNLIGNAFDHVSDLDNYMKQVGLKIDRLDDYYVFEVTNCGHIDEIVAGKIFDRGVTSKTGHHAGLGLSIVHKLVHQHRGKILFANEHNKVVFTVYLPMRKEDQNESIRSATGAPTGQELARHYL